MQLFEVFESPDLQERIPASPLYQQTLTHMCWKPFWITENPQKNWQAQTSKQDQIEIIVANEKSIGPKQLMCLLSKINDLLHRFGHKHLFWFIVVLTELTWEMSRPASTPALHKTPQNDRNGCHMMSHGNPCAAMWHAMWERHGERHFTFTEDVEIQLLNQNQPETLLRQTALHQTTFTPCWFQNATTKPPPKTTTTTTCRANSTQVSQSCSLALLLWQ